MSAIYLDYNASGLVRTPVQELMAEVLAEGGNPNAVHALGRRARARVETARAQVAALVGADGTAVTFSSGGTESNAQAVASAISAGCQRLIVSATEHPCVSEAAAHTGVLVEVVRVGTDGVVDLDQLTALLNQDGPALVAIHHANNESGVIQPVAEAARLVHDAGGWLHVDAIQSAGKIAVDMGALGADSLTLSGHKLGGPQGTGAMVLKEGRVPARILHGAGQERGYRAGTENVPGIAGFGLAAELAALDLGATGVHAIWRDEAEARVRQAGATIIGDGAPRLPNTLFMAVADWESPQQLITLDLAGVMISAGSACSSGKTKPSKTVMAMGLEPLALGAVRVSGGWGTTRDHWQRFAEVWTRAYGARRARQQVHARESV